MDTFIDWIVRHAELSHWMLFGAILLAGINIPISIDLLVIVAGFLAATVIPDHFWHLYFAILLGCYFSAWNGYWFGRLLGRKLTKYGWFNRIFPHERMVKIQRFYGRYGIWTFLVGRFIPFGVRNCLFMSSGMSRISFFKFAVWDFFACLLWASTAFYTFYTLGSNYSVLFQHLKVVNLAIFGAFSVTVIALIWYKRRKKRTIENESIQ